MVLTTIPASVSTHCGDWKKVEIAKNLVVEEAGAYNAMIASARHAFDMLWKSHYSFEVDLSEGIRGIGDAQDSRSYQAKQVQPYSPRAFTASTS
jgi:hypothetical protein